MRSIKVFKIIAVLIVLSFVFFSGCTSLSGSDRNVTTVSEGQSTPSYSAPSYVSNGGSSNGKSTDSVSGHVTGIVPAIPAPTTTADSNVYTNLSGRMVINKASLQLETGDHDRT